MKDAVASRTARSVAAHRLDYARLPAGYGDPAADEALARDVAAGLQPKRDERMHDYLRARTAFFDQVVVTAIEGGMTQVVVGAAGYDGRSLRYARPGIQWFELDHPATQHDKRERLARLGIDVSSVRFAAADFTTDSVAQALRDVGVDTRQPALFLFEGIAAYLDRPVLESVLAQFRAITVEGSLLAISVSLASAARRAGARARFAASVAAVGEPARSVLEPAEATALLARAGWRVAEPGQVHSAQGDRHRAVGLLAAHAAERAVAPAPVSPASGG